MAAWEHVKRKGWQIHRTGYLVFTMTGITGQSQRESLTLRHPAYFTCQLCDSATCLQPPQPEIIFQLLTINLTNMVFKHDTVNLTHCHKGYSLTAVIECNLVVPLNSFPLNHHKPHRLILDQLTSAHGRTTMNYSNSHHYLFNFSSCWLIVHHNNRLFCTP